ncbi:Ankyrin Repeat Domain-Containing Protein 6 [Manis pentadactyla]|nr:Ankyrin Repeat Domain-Containing Protein 6 [Manis pentadactyla]
MVDANGYGEETETLALRKGLDSGSDVAGVQDGGSGFVVGAAVTSMFQSELGSVLMEARVRLRLRVKMVLQVVINVEGECSNQLQDYSDGR